MGILITFGSYMKKETSIEESTKNVEIFDTAIAIMAGLMIIPAVYVFAGTDGMAQGPSLMFVSLPKVFAQMGVAGNVIGCLFFAMVFFAALTSAVSVMEAVVSSITDKFHVTRTTAGIIEWLFTIVVGIIVCLGYNKLYFEVELPNGSIAQILDVMDYISNNILMPIVAIGTCILIGWVAKPQTVMEEVQRNGEKFSRKGMYVVMIKFITPVLLFILFLKSVGLLKMI